MNQWQVVTGDCVEVLADLDAESLDACVGNAAGVKCVASPVTAKMAKGTGGPSGDDCQNLIAGTLRVGVRRLTPRECERLQGFPDDWTAGHADSRRYQMLGNAVAVPVAEWIGRRLGRAEL